MEPIVEPASDVVDVRWLVHSVWHHRRLTLLCALLGALVGLSISLISTKYFSQGLLLTPGVAVGDYKHYQAAIGNERLMRQFFDTRSSVDSEVRREMLRLLEVPGDLAEAIRPEFAYTDRDAKQYGVRFENPGDMVGINLRLPQVGSGASVLVLAEYVRDVVIKVESREKMLSECIDQTSLEMKLRNEQIDRAFQISQQQAMVETLESILKNVPGAAAADSRQVVALEGGAERYLSPIAQLVGAQVRIEQLHAEERASSRNRIAAGHKRKFYCTASQVLDEPISGRDFIGRLQSIQNQLFETVDMTAEINEQVSNSLTLFREQLDATYISQMRFVASPEGSIVRERKPGRLLGLIGGAMLGLLFGVVVSLWLTWWRHNREAVIADE